MPEEMPETSQTANPTEVTEINQAVTTAINSPPITKLTKITILKSCYIKWDSEKCTFCSRCLMLCAATKEGAVAPQLSAIKWVNNDYFSGLPICKVLFCQQCPQPQCYHACPLKDKALCIDPTTGASYINKEKCTGCSLCALACPFEETRINIDKKNGKKVAIKCDLCKNRKNGPVCIEVCNAKALTLEVRKGKL